MITIKYTKDLTAKYMSHLDMQRLLMRAIKRAGFIPKYSMGHNPHPILKMSPPIPLSIVSIAEYFSIEIEHENALGLAEKLNLFLPPGVRCLKAWKTARMPRITRYADATTYSVENLSRIDIKKIADFLQTPRGATLDDISKNIIDVIRKVGESNLIVSLPTGRQNVRIDKFLDAVNVTLGVDLNLMDVKKTNLELLAGNYIDADLYLSEMQDGLRYE